MVGTVGDTKMETMGLVEEAQSWAAGLEKMLQRIRKSFVEVGPFQRAVSYIKGLLSSGIERKNNWQIAEALGEETPYNVQFLLTHAKWDADAVRDDLQYYVQEHLGEGNGIFILDETGFIKKGAKSVGVQRQYSGTVGKRENCQIGVSTHARI